MFGCVISLASIAHAQEQPQYRVVDSKELPEYWIARPGDEQRPVHYPANAVYAGVESCLEVGFSIDAQGVPGNFAVLRSAFTDGADRKLMEILKTQTIDAIAATRYDAAAANAQHLAVYTHRLFTFTLAESRLSKAAREAHGSRVDQSCRIDNFSEFVDRSPKRGS